MTFTSSTRLDKRRDPLLTEKVVFAVGPQHPSLPAPVQFHVQCDGELIERITPECGFMHRGIERLCQQRTWNEAAGLLSRCEWLGGANADYLVATAVEQLAGIEVSDRDQWLRMVALELARIASHLFWWGQIGLEAGAVTPIFLCMRERELALDLIEMLSGHRYHGQWIVPGGIRSEPPAGFWQNLSDFNGQMQVAIEQYEQFFSDNAIWINRTEQIGSLEPEFAIAHGATGPVLRSSGINCDLRKDQPYLKYSEVDFEVPCGEHGDCLDRYRVRMVELRESLKILEQCGQAVGATPASPESDTVSYTNTGDAGVAPTEIPKGEIYVAVESPRGELGLTVVSDGSDKPARMHLRSPSLYHLQIINELCRGHLLADLFVIYGSLDIMIGEVDR